MLLLLLLIFMRMILLEFRFVDEGVEADDRRVRRLDALPRRDLAPGELGGLGVEVAELGVERLFELLVVADADHRGDGGVLLQLERGDGAAAALGDVLVGDDGRRGVGGGIADIGEGCKEGFDVVGLVQGLMLLLLR